MSYVWHKDKKKTRFFTVSAARCKRCPEGGGGERMEEWEGGEVEALLRSTGRYMSV